MHQNVDPLYRSWICADAYDLVRSGRLNANVLYAISAASSGSIEHLDLLESTLSRYRRGSDPSHLQFSPEGEFRPYGDVTTNAVRSFLTDQLAREITFDRRFKRRDRIAVPPSPLSQEFIPYLMAQHPGLGEEVAKLGALKLWHEALLSSFFRIMGKGIEQISDEDLLDTRRLEIARRKEWFDDMMSLGQKTMGAKRTAETLGHFFMDRMHKGLSDESIRAMAWLNKFLPTTELDGTIAALAGALLVYELHTLHSMAPALIGLEFTRLLTPFLSKMTSESIEEELRNTDAPEERFMIFRANTILSWHREPSNKVVEKLVAVVKGNDGCSTLEDFCETMLAVDVNALGQKIGSLSAAGMDISPLLFALGKRFADWGPGGGQGGAASDSGEGMDPEESGNSDPGDMAQNFNALPTALPFSTGISLLLA